MLPYMYQADFMKLFSNFQVALLHKHTALVSSSTKPTTINMKDLKHMSTPIINNGLSRSRLSVKSKGNTISSVDSKKQKKCNLYGHVAGEESDSENSSVYHEPYKLLPNAKQEYGCLLKKDAISSSKSGEYTGRFRLFLMNFTQKMYASFRCTPRIAFRSCLCRYLYLIIHKR